MSAIDSLNYQLIFHLFVHFLFISIKQIYSYSKVWSSVPTENKCEVES